MCEGIAAELEGIDLAQLQQLWSNLRYFPVFLVMILS